MELGNTNQNLLTTDVAEIIKHTVQVFIESGLSELDPEGQGFTFDNLSEDQAPSANIKSELDADHASSPKSQDLDPEI